MEEAGANPSGQKSKSIKATFQPVMRRLFGPSSYLEKKGALEGIIANLNTGPEEKAKAQKFLDDLTELKEAESLPRSDPDRARRLKEAKANAKKSRVELKKWYQKTLSGLINKKAIAPAAVAGVLGAVLVQKKIPQKTWDKMKGLWSGKMSTPKPLPPTPTKSDELTSFSLLSVLIIAVLALGVGLLCWYYCGCCCSDDGGQVGMDDAQLMMMVEGGGTGGGGGTPTSTATPFTTPTGGGLGANGCDHGGQFRPKSKSAKTSKQLQQLQQQQQAVVVGSGMGKSAALAKTARKV